MLVGVGVSLAVYGQAVDPAVMLGGVAALAASHGIEVKRVGNIVRFAAGEMPRLTVLAEPLGAWWLLHEPTTAGNVVLRFVGPNGVSELTYCVPGLVVESVRCAIELESGQIYEV